MKALTLRHPWPFAVCYLGKDVENPDWDDHLTNLNRAYDLIGERIAIHGGSAPQRPKRATPLAKLSENNPWRQHCEDIDAIRYGPMLGQPLPQAARDYLESACPAGPLTPEHFILPGVVAVATVQRLTRTSQSAWAVPGALHIELSEVIVLPRAVQTGGKQGIWTLDPDIDEAVQRQLTRWSVAQVPPPAHLDAMTASEVLR